MHTLNLRVDDSIFENVKTMLSGFIKEKQIEVLEQEDDYYFENNYPDSVVVSSVEEVRKRVYAAETRIEKDGGLNQEQYDKEMDRFFKEELGIDR